MKSVLFSRCYRCPAPLPSAHFGYLQWHMETFPGHWHSPPQCLFLLLFFSLPKDFIQHSLDALTSYKHKCPQGQPPTNGAWKSVDKCPSLSLSSGKILKCILYSISVDPQKNQAPVTHSYNLTLGRCPLFGFSFFPILLCLLPHLHFLGSPSR